MAKYWEDWSGQTLGAAPTGWSYPWGTNFITGPIVESDTDGPAGRRLRVSPNTKRHAYTLDAVDSDPDRANVKVRALMRLGGATNVLTIYQGVAARVAGSNSNETAYISAFFQEGGAYEQLALQRYSGGASSQPYISTNANVWAINTLYWLKIDAIGDQITVAIAPFGDELNDIDSATVTDTGISAAGGAGFFTFTSTGNPYDILAVAIATGTDEAFYSDPNAGGDTTAPTLTNPTGTASGDTTASGTVDTNEDNGTLYWVASTSATAPSVAQIQAGQDSTGAAAAASGNQAVSATGTQNVSASGLTASTTYYFHYQHQDAAANDSTVVTSPSFTTQASDTTAPTLSSATVNGTALTLTYDEALDEASVPATGDFAVTGSTSGAVSVSGVGVSGTNVNLTLASAVVQGETVSLDYTPGASPIQDTAGNDAASLTGQAVTNNTSSDLAMDGDFDSGNLDPVGSSITNPGAAEPSVTIQPRKQTTTTQSNTWQHFFFRLDNANGKRPSFTCLDMGARSDGTGGDNRPWYSYDLHNWFRPAVTATVNASNELTWQWGTAFTQDTVYVAYQAVYQLAQSRKLIDWAVANYPERIHRLPSVGDDADWKAGTVAGQTDDLGRNLPDQPMRGFGVWESDQYPDDAFPKRTIVVTSGIHAGEHDGCWVFDGFMRWLISSTSAEATAIRKNCQVFVYPNINPVGRYGGHFRGQWDPADVTADPNRDWGTRVLNSSQVLEAALAKDIGGRTPFLYYEFHSWTNTTGDFFSYAVSPTPANAKSLFDSVMTAIGISDHRTETGSTHLRRWLYETYGVPHSYALEVVERGTHDQAALITAGEQWGQGVDGVWQQDVDGYNAFTGTYVAETLAGSATVGRQLDAAVYPWPPSLGDTPAKVERGLGADAARAFRMDMGGATGEVFVVLSSVDYEALNTDAAAGANIVTVKSA